MHRLTSRKQFGHSELTPDLAGSKCDYMMFKATFER